MLDSKGDLAAAELAFYAPAFLISILVVVRHGFSRQAGWLYLSILSIFRIVGASCLLYAQVNNDDNPSLIEAAAITSAIGTAPLLLALMGFVQRINQGMEVQGISPMIFRPIQLIAVVGLILAIVGGVNESSETSSSGGVTSGSSLMEAASILFLAIYLALTAITLFNVTKQRWVLAAEKTLLRACVLVLPFLLVRVIYTVCVAFAKPGSVFYLWDINVYCTAFMQFLMEAVVICLYIFAGLMTPKAPKNEIKAGARDGDVEMDGGRVEIVRGPQEQEGGWTAPKQERQQQYQQPRSLGDYRPSRLIMSAMNDRR